MSTEPTQDDDPYPCIGICSDDPDSGYCLGCGRPPLGERGIVAEVAAVTPPPVPNKSDPDTPA